MDRWEGTFPSEDAAKAWAAIDALARQYVTDGACAAIEGARAKALTDLVAGNATIDTVITVTVPATALTEQPDAARRPDPAERGPRRADGPGTGQAPSAQSAGGRPGRGHRARRR